IRAYLFEGVENSNVAAIVEGTPLLLHASLLSFFIGLIFFLHPISNIMTFLSAGLLAAFGIAYLSATIAPFIDTASPIRTPLTTLVLQFSFARNLLRKASLCGLKLTSACLKALKKFFSIFSCKSQLHATEMQSPSEFTEGTRIVAKHWLEPFAEIWSDNTLCTSDLDTIKESTALNDSLPEFHKREMASLSWTLQHTTNDSELLLFLEGIPIYLSSCQRDASAVVTALLSLFENNVHPYHESTGFLHSRASTYLLHWFMNQVIHQYPSLSPAIRYLNVRAVLRCAQARGSKYNTTYDDVDCWPFISLVVPVKSFGFSDLRPFWDAIGSFLGLKWDPNGELTAPTAAKEATAAEKNQVIALFSLCIFCWQAVPDPQGHFTDTFGWVMEELISYASPLAEGSAGAQRAYSAAGLLIASALEEASPEL
ncbi:hypothetical protein C8J56DRAFT_1124129, partial [Mycena floridula]